MADGTTKHRLISVLLLGGVSLLLAFIPNIYTLSQDPFNRLITLLVLLMGMVILGLCAVVFQFFRWHGTKPTALQVAYILAIVIAAALCAALLSTLWSAAFRPSANDMGMIGGVAVNAILFPLVICCTMAAIRSAVPNTTFRAAIADSVRRQYLPILLITAACCAVGICVGHYAPLFSGVATALVSAALPSLAMERFFIAASPAV